MLFMIHDLCEFSAAIQLAATFNLGCVALFRRKTFARALASFFFKVDSTIDSTIKKIKDEYASTSDTINNIPYDEIDEDDINKVEKAKQNLRKINNDIQDDIKNLPQKIDSSYTPSYLDSICIIIGTYCIYELILSAFLSIDTICSDYFTYSFYTLNCITFFVTFILFYFELQEAYIKTNKRTSGNKVHKIKLVNAMKVILKTKFLAKHKTALKDTRSAAYISIYLLIITCLFPAINKIFNPIIYYNENLFKKIYFILGLVLPYIPAFFYFIFLVIKSKKVNKMISIMQRYTDDFDGVNKLASDIRNKILNHNNISTTTSDDQNDRNGLTNTTYSHMHISHYKSSCPE